MSNPKKRPFSSLNDDTAIPGKKRKLNSQESLTTKLLSAVENPTCNRNMGGCPCPGNKDDSDMDPKMASSSPSREDNGVGDPLLSGGGNSSPNYQSHHSNDNYIQQNDKTPIQAKNPSLSVNANQTDNNDDDNNDDDNAPDIDIVIHDGNGEDAKKETKNGKEEERDEEERDKEERDEEERDKQDMEEMIKREIEHDDDDQDKPPKFQDDDDVRVKIAGCTTWLESTIMSQIAGSSPHKYRVRIRRSAEFRKQINGNYIRILEEKDIRNNSQRAAVLTSISDMNEDITDLYLNGRDLQSHLGVLTEGIKELHNSQWTTYRERRSFEIKLIQARYFAIEILNYCEPAKFHWRLYCFWCRDEDIEMHRSTCRQHVIAAGAKSEGYYGDALSLMAFCDECNTELAYEDYSYRCANKEHDICLQCVFKKCVNYQKRLNEIKKILMDDNGMDRYSCQIVFECIAGNVRKFEGPGQDSIHY